MSRKMFYGPRGGLYIQIDYDVDTLPFLKSLPGSKWEPVLELWSISSSIENRARILEVAEQLEIEVPDEIRNIDYSDEACDLVDAAQQKGLYPFQIKGVEFLVSKKKAMLGDDMGLGKTPQAIMSLPPNERVLIICPSVVKHNWRKEILNWRSDYEVFVAVKKNDVRPPKTGEIVVVNHDILPGKLAGNRAVIPKEYYGLVIVSDEAHYAKNRKSIRTKKVRALCMKASKVIGLTGTPLANHPMDLYGVLWSHDLDIEAFGGMAGFVRAYGGTEGDYGGYVFGKPRPEAPELLRRVMLRRLKEDVLPELPKKAYRNLEIPLSNEIKKEMDEIDKVYGTLIMKGDLPPFDKFSKVRKALASDRIPAMLEIVEGYEEAERPLLVFSAHRDPIDALAQRPGWAVITGDIPSEERFEIAERFQRGELIGIALTIAAGGVGLTLTRAPEILFVDLAWRPCDNAQAEDRICRIGQTSDSVLITRMMSDHPLDKHVNQLLIDKQLLIESVVERSGADNLLMGNRQEIFDLAEKKIEELRSE